MHMVQQRGMGQARLAPPLTTRTYLTASVPHGDGVIVRGVDPLPCRVGPADLAIVVGNKLGSIPRAELGGCALTKGAHVVARG